MGKLKLLIAGIVFGVTVIFAFIGIKSLMNDRKLVTADTGGSAPAPIQGYGEPTPPSSTLPTTTTGDNSLTQQDMPLAGTDNKIEVTLEGEPDDTTDPATPAVDPTAATTSPTTTIPETSSQTASTATTPSTTAATTTQTNPADTTATAPTGSLNAGQSTTDNNQPAPSGEQPYGQLKLSIIDQASPNGEIDGEFVVYDAQGVQVGSFAGGEETSFDLEPGKYMVKVRANDKEASRTLEVYVDKITSARFEMPSTPSTQTASQQSGTNATQTTPSVANNNGQIFISVRAAESSQSLKSNIYVQKLNGENVAKSNYADGAEFTLAPGVYRLTVKAQGRRDIVREIRVSANGIVRETFALAAIDAPATTTPAPTPAPAPSAQTNNERSGILRLSLATDVGLPERARFVIRKPNGDRVATVGPAPSGEIKLPPGEYEITAGIQGLRQSRTVRIEEGKVINLGFNAVDILSDNGVNPSAPPSTSIQVQPPVPTPAPATQNAGLLRLYAISGVDRQALPVNFTVRTLQGQVLQSFNNVAFAEVRVPPQTVLVDINYQSMQGRETIAVNPNEPTEFTFTISPN